MRFSPTWSGLGTRTGQNNRALEQRQAAAASGGGEHGAGSGRRGRRHALTAGGRGAGRARSAGGGRARRAHAALGGPAAGQWRGGRLQGWVSRAGAPWRGTGHYARDQGPRRCGAAPRTAVVTLADNMTFCSFVLGGSRGMQGG